MEGWTHDFWINGAQNGLQFYVSLLPVSLKLLSIKGPLMHYIPSERTRGAILQM